MNAKTLTTILLLGFIAASVVVAVVKNAGSGPGGGEDGEAAPAAMVDGLAVYYFHGKARCPTCETIEAFAHESVHGAFADQLADGRMQWRAVDYETPENAHFAEEFELIAATVVVARVEGGTVGQWKNLARVWELVGEKDEFLKYVREEIETMAGDGDE